MKIITDNLEEGDITMMDAGVDDVMKMCVQDMRVATGVLGAHDRPDLREMVGKALGEEFASLQDAVAHIADRFNQTVPDDIHVAAKAIDEADGTVDDTHVIVLEVETFGGDEHTLVFNQSQAIDLAVTIAEWAEALHAAGNCDCGNDEHGEATG